jgi:RNA polymerase sigma factor (sigma-70 family)
VLEEVFRDEWGRVLASLVGFLGDFDRAEDAAQEAFAIAAQRWPSSGVPAKPGAWLVTTARNRAIDRIRRERTLAEKIHLLPAPEAIMDEFDDTVIKDERLELIFTCCHPALPLEGQVALTLWALGGLRTADIARAFLASEETMKRRLSRAKTKIKATGIPFAVPDARRRTVLGLYASRLARPIRRCGRSAVLRRARAGVQRPRRRRACRGCTRRCRGRAPPDIRRPDATRRAGRSRSSRTPRPPVLP